MFVKRARHLMPKEPGSYAWYKILACDPFLIQGEATTADSMAYHARRMCM